MASGGARHAFRRHRKIEPSWKKEVLQNRGKRDETPSAIKGILQTPSKPTVLVKHKDQQQVLLGAALKRRTLV